MFNEVIKNIFNIKNTFVNTLFKNVWITNKFLYRNEEFFIHTELNLKLKYLVEDFWWIKSRFNYYLNNWIYTTNHKRIAMNYFWFIVLSGLCGMALATIIRLEMAYPGPGILAGDSLQYLSIVTAHGVIMVFFMIMPLLFGAFSNFLLPTQLGVHDVAFPRLNSAAFWFLPAGLIMLCQLVCIDRRYYRINCFNFKEVESLLKQKYSYELITNNLYSSKLNSLNLQLNYKLTDITVLNHNVLNLNTYNLNLTNNRTYVQTVIGYMQNVDYSHYNSSFLPLNFIADISIKFDRLTDKSRLLESFSWTYYVNYVVQGLLVCYYKFTLGLVGSTIWYLHNYLSYLSGSSTYEKFSKIGWKPSTSELKFITNLSTNSVRRLQFKFNLFIDTRNCIRSIFNIICTWVLNILTLVYSELRVTINKLNYIYYAETLSLVVTRVVLYGLTTFVYIVEWSTLKVIVYLKAVLQPIIYGDMESSQYWVKVVRVFLFETAEGVRNWKEMTASICKLINYKNLMYMLDWVTKNIVMGTFTGSKYPLTLTGMITEPSYLVNYFYTFGESLQNYYNIHDNAVIRLVRTLSLKINLDTVVSKRHLQSENPIYKYDYKAGVYLSETFMVNYQHLLNTIDQAFGGFKKGDWFISDSLATSLTKYLKNYLNLFSLLDVSANSQFIYYYNNNFLSYFDIFFFILDTYTKANNSLTNRWVDYNNLEFKFKSLFFTQTLQTRIYNNWRELKFTRESWRCRLLIARHQRTLFRRYTHEDNLFWTLERNAKDLLPGWAMITPFSARIRYTVIGKTDIGLMAILLTITASIINSTNFLITYRYLSTLNNRKMRDSRCFFTEGVIVASWMMIAANPMLILAIIMLLFDRHWRTSFFDYSGGGDTILFQHMFWFFGHPEVYIIIIPCFGFTNTILAYYLRKRISARASLIYSMYTIAVLGFFVWGHHMYMVGLAHTTRMLYSTLTVMISVPAATKLMHWMVTFVNSSLHFELPLLFTLVFIFFFITGGISGMFVAHTGMDVLFHDTLYVVGHFHVLLSGSCMFASFAAFYFYFPALLGVKYSRVYAYLHFIYYILGQFLSLTPMIWLGYAGMPRRVLDYPLVMGGWHSIISGGHILSVGGILAFFIAIFDSIYKGRAVHRNTLGIGRYNNRINFYLYEIHRLHYLRSKQSTLLRPTNTRLNSKRSRIKSLSINFEIYETTLINYKLDD